MRKIAMAFLFCLLSPIANAQEIIDLQKPLKCSKPEAVMNYFRDNFKEMPMWVGKTNTNTYVRVDGTTGSQNIQIAATANVWQQFNSSGIKLQSTSSVYQLFDSTT